MEKADGYKRDLLSGDKLEVRGNLVVFTVRDQNGNPVTNQIDFRREVELDDVKTILVIYASGTAARSRQVRAAFELFLRSFDPVVIVGYKDPEEEDPK